jgi:hypothetical protein
MESDPMSTAASEPHEARRRRAFPWRRMGAVATRPGRGPRRPVAYAPEALPERQPSLAALVPTTLGRFAATAATVILLVAGVIAAGLFESLTGRPLVPATALRFTAAVDGLRQCIDLRSSGTLGSWIGHVGLLTAAAGALVVRQLRRHRLDDRRGRSAAWGWLAALFLLTSCAGQLPVGAVYAGLLSGVSGAVLGAGGQGWWVLTAGIAYTVVGLWAVLPLHERAGTAAWLALSGAAWAVAGGCAWVAEGVPHQAAVGQAAWIAGAAFAVIAMLAAARSVVREVRGLTRAPMMAARPQSSATTGDDGRRGPAAAAAPETPPPTEYIDGDSGEDGFETDGRPLSKAERKRLRKLARMSRAA